MISVIVSTHNELNLSNVKTNIQQTIGVPYELIAIDNRAGRGLCEVYNEGTKKARFPILCFAHEDIRLITENWGGIVASIFQQNTRLGLLGVAGSTYKSYAPASWGLLEQARSVNIIQHYKFVKQSVYNHYENHQNSTLAKAVCIDGVWMCTKKEIAQEIGFDQRLFTSFHCYDLDFSLGVFQRYDVAVTFDVLMEHYSEGRSDKNWVTELLKLHRKWKTRLPITLEPFSEQLLKKTEEKAIEKAVSLMLEYGFSLAEIVRVINGNSKNPHVSADELRRMKFSAVKEYIKRHMLPKPLLRYLG